MQTINVTPQNQISPKLEIRVRTDTLRHLLSDLRANGKEIASAMGATGGRKITLDDGTEIVLTQAAAHERGSWYPGTCVACRLDPTTYDTVAKYRIFPS